jgi:geranylgeranyl diphosphate synthase type II
MIHAYSLIHDDLPAMDNDDLRRGKPTNHIVFGQAHAILAADALNTAAPAFLLKELNKLNVSAEIICKITTSLLDACGYEGMIKGQALDIEAERGLISAENKIDLLSEIHQKKTGELIRWSFLAGLYSTLRPEIINQYEARLSEIGKKYGLLYQIIDDILDETASLSDLGKTPGKDKKNGKLTYPQIFGIDQSKREARKIIMEVEQSLLELQYHSPLLQKMIYELKLFALN